MGEFISVVLGDSGSADGRRGRSSVHWRGGAVSIDLIASADVHV